MIDLNAIDRLTGGRLGTFDLPCPLCSPLRKAANQRKPVLRIWRDEPTFATFSCVHCGEHGYVLERNGKPPDPMKVAKARVEAAERDRASRAQRRGAAKWLWTRRRPIAASIAEIYLRRARGYGGPIPATLGFLPAHDEYPPALIAAYGPAIERESGALAIAAADVAAVHLVRLLPDGSDRLRDIDDAKKTVGPALGFPIVLAPMTDMLALVLGEGPEKVLTAHEATGAGAWCSGGATFLPALADAVPSYVETVSIIVDDNEAGRDDSAALGERLRARFGEAIELRFIT
jgi:hypothetical protein